MRPAPCHPERPHYGRGLCRLCYGKQPDVVEKARVRGSENRKKLTPEQRRATHRLSKYGVGPGEVNRVLEAQEYLCPICRGVLNEKTGHIDHNHVTGNVREILCGHCNRMLGLAKENPGTLRRAAAYLEQHEGK